MDDQKHLPTRTNADNTANQVAEARRIIGIHEEADRMIKASREQGSGNKLPSVEPSDGPWYPAFLKRIRGSSSDPK